MKKIILIACLGLVASLLMSCSSPPPEENKLKEWRTGVWLSQGGGFSIWTDTHYFLVTASGDSTAANIYCGASQVVYTEKGIARKQVLRIRQRPNRPLRTHSDFSAFSDAVDGGVVEAPLEIDPELFKPGTCNVVDGIIYDSVTEETDDFILLSSCDGDRIKIFSDGRSAYLPSGGGEYWSYRLGAP